MARFGPVHVGAQQVAVEQSVAKQIAVEKTGSFVVCFLDVFG